MSHTRTLQDRSSGRENVPRIRGRRLQEIRRWFLMANPLCALCHKAGRVALAVILDHIIPLHKGGTNEVTNYQGLCRECNRIKTDADLGRQSKPTIGSDGWPE